MNIQLSDDRIDAMRTNVLDRVDDEIAQRGSRTRKVITGGVGALALVTVLGMSIPALTGSPSHEVAASRGADSSTGNVAIPAPAGGAPEASTMKDMAPVPPDQPLTAPGKNREVITSGSAEVTVKDPADRATRFTAWVEKHGGRVDARSESRDDSGHTSAHVVARIPSKQVSSAVNVLRTYGVVESVDLQRDDVTAQGQDLDARIKALKISVARLEGILQRAGSSSDVVDAETALSDRQQELASLELQRRSLNDQVSLSTISVAFTQESKPGSVTPGGFRGGFVKGWNALVDTVNAIVTAAGAAVPWLGIAGAVGLVWWGARRARRRS